MELTLGLLLYCVGLPLTILAIWFVPENDSDWKQRVHE